VSDTTTPTAAELRESVRDYRDPDTSPEDRDAIAAWWKSHGIRNQFGALLRAAEVEGKR
jgi:hypothetical protein